MRSCIATRTPTSTASTIPVSSTGWPVNVATATSDDRRREGEHATGAPVQERLDEQHRGTYRTTGMVNDAAAAVSEMRALADHRVDHDRNAAPTAAADAKTTKWT